MEKNFYDGQLKTCKIFQYMVDHDCTLEDFHMIVLENLKGIKDKEILRKKEREYFNEYYPASIGFNQYNSVIKYIENNFSQKYNLTDKELIDFCYIVKEDINNIIEFKDYGYSEFNYKRMFFSQIPYNTNESTKETKKYVENLNKQLLGLKKIFYTQKEIEEILEESKEEYRIRIKSLSKSIMPKKEYNAYPLKDMYSKYKRYEFKSSSDNICEINLVVSNNARNKYPEILKIDYRIKINEEIIEKRDIFIESIAHNNIINKEKIYLDKSEFSIFSNNKFKITVEKNNGLNGYSEREHIITTECEYKTFINDYTISKHELFKLDDVIKEIEKNINKNTKIIFNISESAKCAYIAFKTTIKRPSKSFIIKELEKKLNS